MPASRLEVMFLMYCTEGYIRGFKKVEIENNKMNLKLNLNIDGNL